MFTNIKSIKNDKLKEIDLNYQEKEKKEIVPSLLKNLGERQEIINKIADATLLAYIIEHMDWEILEDKTTNKYGEDQFFNGDGGILKSLIENNVFYSTEQPKSTYWNDSIADLISLFQSTINPKGVADYENSGLLIEYLDEDKKGYINTDYLKGSIQPKGASAALRITDIKKADAAASFLPEEEMYWDGLFFEEGSVLTLSDGDNTATITLNNVLLKNDGYTLFLSLLNGETVTTEALNTVLGSKNENIHVGTPDYKPDDLSQLKQVHGVLEGTYQLFKVANKTWVIPWYNVDGATYSKVRGTDRKLSALNNEKNLDFTHGNPIRKKDWVRLIMPQYKRKVEIEDLDRNFWVIGQILTGISASLLDEDGPINHFLRGLLKEIAQLWENVLFLWTEAITLSQKKYYNEIHKEVVFISYNELHPYLKYDNFNKFEATINDKSVEQYLNYLINMYEEYNLVILPQIRMDNYEHNYYASVIIPGLYIYDRNKEEWIVQRIKDINSELNYLKIDSANFSEYIYGIKENETTYDYIAPLSEVGEVLYEKNTRYYGLLRDEIIISPTYNSNNWNVDIEINLYDLAKALIKNENGIVDKANDKVYHRKWSISNVTADAAAPESYSQSDSELNKEEGSVLIKKGYYQGELLSGYKNGKAIQYHFVIMQTAYLSPTTYSDSDTLKQWYISDSASDVREKDNTIFQSILDKSFKYYVDYKKDKAAFLSNEIADAYASDKYNFYQLTDDAGKVIILGEDGNYTSTVLSASEGITRQQAPLSTYSLVNSSGSDYDKFYSTEDKWKDSIIDKLAPQDKNNIIDKEAILFIEGKRDYNYYTGETGNDGVSARKASDVNCNEYFPYHENSKICGTPAPILGIIRGRAAINTGAGLRFYLPNGEIAQGYYKNHKSHSVSTDFPGYYSEFIRNYTTKDYITWSLGGDKDYQNVTPQFLSSHTPDEIYHLSGGGGGTTEQYLLMRKNNTNQITKESWLLIILREGRVEPHFYLNSKRTYMERYLAHIENESDDDFYRCLLRIHLQNLWDELENSNKNFRYGDNNYTLTRESKLNVWGYYLDYLMNSWNEEGDLRRPLAKWMLGDINIEGYRDRIAKKYKGLEHYAYYEQVILRNYLYPVFKEQCDIYNTPGNDWNNVIGGTNGLNNEYPNSGHSLDKRSNLGIKRNGIWNDDNERYFITGYIHINLGIYAFGPNGTYYRKTWQRNNGTASNFNPDGYSWIVNDSDKEGDIDALRETYTVIWNSNPLINIEKYKTKNQNNPSNYNAIQDYNNNYGSISDDTSDYNINWEDSDEINQYE